jgi:hypothetical protein
MRDAENYLSLNARFRNVSALRFFLDYGVPCFGEDAVTGIKKIRSNTQEGALEKQSFASRITQSKPAANPTT